MIYTSGRWQTVVDLATTVDSPFLPWDESKPTIEQLLSASINTEKHFKATLFVWLEVCPAGLPNVLCVRCRMLTVLVTVKLCEDLEIYTTHFIVFIGAHLTP